MRIWAGQRLVILSKNPRDFEILLSSQRHLTKSNMYDFMVDWLGTGLLIATGNKWFTRRKIITPTFHFKILQQFVEVFHQQNRIFIEKLKGRCDGKYFDIYDVVTLMSLDIICETAMGYKLNAQINEENEYVKSVKELVKPLKSMLNCVSNHNLCFQDQLSFIYKNDELLVAQPNHLCFNRSKKTK